MWIIWQLKMSTCFYNFTCYLDINPGPAFQIQAVAAVLEYCCCPLCSLLRKSPHVTEAGLWFLEKSPHAQLQNFILNHGVWGFEIRATIMKFFRDLPTVLVNSKYKSNELANVKGQISYFRKSESYKCYSSPEGTENQPFGSGPERPAIIAPCPLLL